MAARGGELKEKRSGKREERRAASIEGKRQMGYGKIETRVGLDESDGEGWRVGWRGSAKRACIRTRTRSSFAPFMDVGGVA